MCRVKKRFNWLKTNENIIPVIIEKNTCCNPIHNLSAGKIINLLIFSIAILIARLNFDQSHGIDFL